MKDLFDILMSVFIIYFVYSNLISLMLLCLSFFKIRHIIRSSPMIESIKRQSFRLAPSVSIIAPAYNEAATIVHSVQSFLTLDYPDFDVIVVNDGSKDNSLEKLKESFSLERVNLFYDDRLSDAKIKGVYQSEIHSNLFVIDKENTGKADSINVGVGHSRYNLFCAVDSDSILDADSLVRVAMPFIVDPDRTVASGGTVRPVNGSIVKYGRVVETRIPKSLLARIQIVEYLRAFLFGRVGWSVLDSTLIISGAFGLFKKSAVLEAGGYQKHTVGEDMELVVNLRDHFAEKGEDVVINFVPDPICWTEVPANLKVLGRQRDRWQRGLADSLYRYRHMFFNPRYKASAFLAFPYFVIVECFGPLIEVFAYVFAAIGLSLGYLDWGHLALLFIVDIAYGVLMSFGAVLIEESAYHKYPRLADLLRLLLASVAEHIGYRQFNTFWRLRGLVKFLRGVRHWGEMSREGFEEK